MTHRGVLVPKRIQGLRDATGTHIAHSAPASKLLCHRSMPRYPGCTDVPRVTDRGGNGSQGEGRWELFQKKHP
jgi:hypothetical protein